MLEHLRSLHDTQTWNENQQMIQLITVALQLRCDWIKFCMIESEKIAIYTIRENMYKLLALSCLAYQLWEGSLFYDISKNLDKSWSASNTSIYHLIRE